MKMLFKLMLFVCSISVILLCGCVASNPDNLPENQTNQVDDARDGEKLMIKAIQQRDYSLLNGFLSQNLAKVINRATFDAFCNELDKCGAFETSSFITELTLPVFTTGVWKFRYCRNLDDGSKVYHDKLILITTGKLDGRKVITGLAVQ